MRRSISRRLLLPESAKPTRRLDDQGPPAITVRLTEPHLSSANPNQIPETYFHGYRGTCQWPESRRIRNRKFRNRKFRVRKFRNREIPEQEIRRDPYQPTTRECAMLLLQLIEAKHTETEGKDAATRTRLSEATLRKLWCRSRLTTEFVHGVQEWLFMAGWVLFFAGSTYAMNGAARVVDGWMRISAKRLAKEIAEVQRGKDYFR